MPGTLQSRLLNRFQRGFPLTRTPFADIARQLEADEEQVLDTLAQLVATGAVARVGPVFAPNTVGAGTLAALRVPASRLQAVADTVSAHPAVTHNYSRAHPWNLWFVASAADPHSIDVALAQIAAAADCGAMLDLRLEQEYHIDLGFDLADDNAPSRRRPFQCAEGRAPLSAPERALVTAIVEGIPLIGRPFAAVARRCGLAEDDVLRSLERWTASGLVRRFGVVVRHAELGFHANAMAVWDVPDEVVAKRGAALAGEPGVTLCYRRRRARSDWPYNLFCMVHGRTSCAVAAALQSAGERCGLDQFPGAVLPTITRYKQRGPSLWNAREVSHA